MPLLHIVCCHPVTKSLLHVVPLTHRTPIFYFFANFTLWTWTGWKIPPTLGKEGIQPRNCVRVCVCWEMLHVMPLLHIACCHPVTQSLLHVVPLTHRTLIFYFFANFILEVKKFSVVQTSASTTQTSVSRPPRPQHRADPYNSSLLAAEPQEFTLGPRPQRHDKGRLSPHNSSQLAAEPREFTLGPRPQRPDPGRLSPHNSSLLAAEPQESTLGPRPQRRDQGHLSPHNSFLLAAAPQEFTLGPRPQRPDQGRLSPHNPPTSGR